MPFSAHGFCLAALARKLRETDDVIMVDSNANIVGVSEQFSLEHEMPKMSSLDGKMIKITDICKNFHQQLTDKLHTFIDEN